MPDTNLNPKCPDAPKKPLGPVRDPNGYPSFTFTATEGAQRAINRKRNEMSPVAPDEASLMQGLSLQEPECRSARKKLFQS